MAASHRRIFVGLLIAGIGLIDLVVGCITFDNRLELLRQDLPWVLTISQIAAISIWVAVGTSNGLLRLSIAVLIDVLLAWWCVNATNADKWVCLRMSVLFVAVAIGVFLLFGTARLLGLRIISRDAATGTAGIVPFPKLQFSLFSLMLFTTLVGLLAAIVKFLFRAVDMTIAFSDAGEFFFYCLSLTLLTPLAAWLALGCRWASLRWLLVIAFFVLFLGDAALDFYFPEVIVPVYIWVVCPHVCFLWTYLWLFRRCGYVSVWQRRHSVSTVG